MSLRKIILILCCFSLPVQAAAPATHVYFAQLWMDLNGIQQLDMQNNLIAGTLFPDIRYLGTIKRDQTHEKGITTEKIRNSSNQFKAGMRVHAYLDVEREKVVKRTKISSQLSAIPKELRVLFLKTLEDEILWEQVRSQQVLQALVVVYPEEIEEGVTDETAIEWHETLIDYFNQKPSLFLQYRASQGLGFLKADHKTIEEWSRLIPLYAKKPVFLDYMDDLVDTMTKKFSQ
jgi:hypothetical protein